MPRSTKIRQMKTLTLVLAATFLGLGPSMGRAQADKHTLTCGPEKTIGQAIKTLKPGDTLLVSGTCNENIDLGEDIYGITLDGQGTATINGDPSVNTITVTGRGITIRGFTITGGFQCIAVLDGGSAVIDGNTIQNNGAPGIQVLRGSSAQIFTNTIQNNGSHGVSVDRNAQAEIAACTITGNVGDGIRGMRNAGVDIGTDATGATPQFEDDTNTGSNGGFGVRCMVDGFVDGRLGTLTGTLGGKSFTEACTDSVQ